VLAQLSQVVTYVAAAVHWFYARAPNRPIVLYGISLGAAASIFAGVELGALVDGYILVAPYSDLCAATHRRTTRYLPPILDELAYGALLFGAKLSLPHLDRIAPAARALRPD